METNKMSHINKYLVIVSIAVITIGVGYFYTKNNAKISLRDNFAAVSSKPISSSAWKLLGPSNGRVNGVAFTSTGLMLAGTNSGGIFISTNSGQTWTSYNTGLGSHHINQIKSINGDVYVAADDGVYKLVSTAWTKIYSPPVSFGKVGSVLNSETTIFALGQYGFAKMQGNVWVSYPPPGNDPWLLTMLISNNKTFYVGGFNGLYKSTDGGITWSHPFSTSGVWSIIEGLPGDIYLTANSGQLYKEVDGVFTALTSAPRSNLGTMIYQNQLLVATFDSIYQSTDNGLSFSLLIKSPFTFSGENTFWDVRQMLFVSPSSLILSHDNGISAYNFGSKTLVKYRPINYYSEIASLGVDSNQNLATTYWDHGGNYLANGTTSWSHLSADERDYLFASPRDKGLYVGISHSYIYLVSALGTQLWSNPSVLVYNPKGSISFGLQSSPTRVYALYYSVGRDSVLSSKIKSFNLTSNIDLLDEKDITLPFNSASAIAVDPANQSHIIVFAENKFYQSTNGGATWDNGIASLYQNTLLSCENLAISPFNSSEYLISCGGGTNNLVLKVVGGTINSIGLPASVRSYAIAYDNLHKGTIYAGSETGFFYSTNGGETWQTFNQGLYTGDIRVIRFMNDNIYVGTWGSGNAVINRKNLLRLKSEIL